MDGTDDFQLAGRYCNLGRRLSRDWRVSSLVVGSQDGTVKMFDCATGSLLSKGGSGGDDELPPSFSAGNSGLGSVQAHAYGRQVNVLRFFDPSHGGGLTGHSGTGPGKNCGDSEPMQATMVLSAGNDRGAVLIDPRAGGAGKVVSHFVGGHHGPITNMEVLGEGCGISGIQEDIQQQQQRGEFGSTSTSSPYFLTASNDGMICVWDARKQ